MTTRSQLVYFPGYPFDLACLTPRYRLAALAGALLAAGHETRIHDFGSLSAFERMYPAAVRRRAQRIHDQVESGRSNQLLQPLTGLLELRRLGKAFTAARAAAAAEFGKRLSQSRHLDFVVFEINSRDDLDAAALIAGPLRERLPHVRVAAVGALGGSHGRALLAAAPWCDAVLKGDAEQAVVRWAEALGSPDRWLAVPHALFRRMGAPEPETPVSTVCEDPVYEPDVYEALESDGKLLLFQIEDGRGCACRCHACPSASTGWQRLRLKSSQQIRGEVQRLRTLFGARVIHFTGGAASVSHALSVVRELAKRGLDIRFSRAGHIAYANPGAFAALRDAGAQAIGFQIDSGSQRLLDDFYGRGLKVSFVERVMNAARQAGLYTVARLTYPAPDEDYHTRAETVRLLGRCRPDGVAIASPEAAEDARWRKRGSAFGFRDLDTAAMTTAHLPKPSVFPFAPRRWQLPAQNLGHLSPSQAVHGRDELLRECRSLGIAAPMDERTALIALTAGARADGAWAAAIQRDFAEGRAENLDAVVRAFNEAACVPAVAAFSPFASLPTAVGD